MLGAECDKRTVQQGISTELCACERMFTLSRPFYEMEFMMATNIVDVEWKEGLTFDAHQQDRTYRIVSSTSDDDRGTGISPKQMLLTALAGCTGMDVASLLPKLRVPFTSMREIGRAHV